MVLLYHFKPRFDNDSQEQQADRPKPQHLSQCLLFILFYTSLTFQMLDYSSHHCKNSMSVNTLNGIGLHSLESSRYKNSENSYNKKLLLYC